MFYNNLLFAFRQLRKNPVLTALNFAGLCLGLGTALVIGLYVRREWNVDSFVPEKNRVFRAIRLSGVGDKPYAIGITAPNYAPALVSDFPGEIEVATRFYPDHIFIQVGDKRFHERKYAYADANFPQFFDLKFLIGNRETALADPFSVALTRKTAEKLFGSPEAAMGKVIRWNDELDVQVSGVVEALPGNSHLEFDYLASIDIFKHRPDNDWWTGWWNNTLCTYVRLAPGVQAANINDRLPGFMDKYFAKDFAQQGGRIDLRLQPLNEIYWDADTKYDPVRHGNRRATNIFALTALFLIAIASFNFINLATAKATERSREVGVRKALGAGRSALGGQFLLESFLLSSGAVCTAVLLANAALPVFNRFFDLELRVSEVGVWEGATWVVAVAVLVGLGAGLYPAALLSGFRPVAALKGTVRLRRSDISVRSGLTTVQFALSIVLIVSTLIVKQQLDFIKNKNLGFDRENVVAIETWGTGVRREKLDLYRRQIAPESGVLGLSVTDFAPGATPDASIINIAGRSDRPKINVLYADFQFAQTLGLGFAAGRDFDPNLKTDSTRAMLLNETACRTLGVTPEQALGMTLTPIYFDTIPRKVVGVLRDYHFLNLRHGIDPLLVLPDYRYPGTLLVRAAPGALPNTLAALQRAWETLDPVHPFEYRMLDERLDRLYRSEQKQGHLFSLFALVAIGIACLGMFGLATLAALQRTKEVGIRKTLGATSLNIAALLSFDFLKLVLFGFLLATPIAFWAMKNWLADFAYRVQIGWEVFALSGLTAVAVAFLTVGSQAIRAALANPVKSLRSE